MIVEKRNNNVTLQAPALTFAALLFMTLSWAPLACADSPEMEVQVENAEDCAVDSIDETTLSDRDCSETGADEDTTDLPANEASDEKDEGSVEEKEEQKNVAPASCETTEQTPAPLYVLDLLDAQRRALADNPSIAAGAERVEQVRQMVSQARSMYYPQIDLNYTYTFSWLPSNYTDSVNAYLDQSEDMLREWRKDQILYSTITRQPSLRNRRAIRSWYRSTQDLIEDARENIESPVENTTMNMTVGLLLFDGFAREFINAQARYGYGEAKAAYREGQRILLDAVAQAYYAAQFAREQIEIGKSDVAFYERLHKEALARREVGRGATSHVLSFETLLYAARASLLRSERDYDMARIVLAMLLGIPEGRLDDRFALAPLEEETPETMTLPDCDAMLSLAFAFRPDMEQSELGLKRASAAVKQQYAQYAPMVAAVGMLQTANVNDTGLTTDRIATTVGINASLNLFSGGRRRAGVIGAKHAKREAELRITETEQKIVSDVNQALTDLKIAQEALALQREASGCVEKNRDLVELEYNAGKAMLVSLSQAQRDFIQAQGMLAQARVNLQRTWQALHAATGTNLAVLNQEIAGELQPDTPKDAMPSVD